MYVVPSYTGRTTSGLTTGCDDSGVIFGPVDACSKVEPPSVILQCLQTAGALVRRLSVASLVISIDPMRIVSREPSGDQAGALSEE